jgi:hypothetical protein
MRLRLRELREGEGVAERSGSELGRKEVCVWCCCVCVAMASACGAEKCCRAASRFSPVEGFSVLA